ncbi:MAG: hypothetical protein M3451_13605 [Chloroflexota bacterium]|nr:hypothetical protein [Chloroflexota bacterium]
MLLVILSGRTGGVARELAVSFRRMVAPAAILTGVSLAIMQPLAAVTDPANGRTVIDYGLFALGLMVAGGVYLLAAWLLRLPEFYRFLGILQRRLGRSETTFMPRP